MTTQIDRFSLVTVPLRLQPNNALPCLTGYLSEISRMPRHVKLPRDVLRVSCRRCERTVEIQTVDAVRLYGSNAIWKDVAQRLLDDTCQQRTGRHEEDGCWPTLEKPH
ncbi:hypothetical protein SAMN05444169_6557 [Bradyrhizobium erythrophlei]|uniref:Uncharacterized protein n=1 Tax=Bradyrhizobium erythrophlei TaxID=1437360 RepID=A0A1M5RGK5_9BRAD|nr:hypothetical protein [Bradyrhizobium erythrophlei]SHH25435.1 hypothetical protein SAMN05444169_6557 [Bradyrhizobium erythrophlei]